MQKSKKELIMNYTLFREARMRKGLSQKELADKIGKYAPYIVDIELGRRDLRISNIEKLCEALDLEITIKPKTNNMSQLPQTNNEEKYDVEYIHAGMLHKDFLQLKEKKQALYLFDYGGFFVAYDEDAVVITEIFKESFLDKTKAGYYMTLLRSTINNNISLKISELQKRGYEVIMVRNS